MAGRTVKPDRINTLYEWVQQWPKKTNLAFDPETGEATVYAPSSLGDKVKSFPWIREGDVISILTNPSEYPQNIVNSAVTVLKSFRDERNNQLLSSDKQYQVITSDLLSQWSLLRTSEQSDRGVIMSKIISLERQIQELERSRASKYRSKIEIPDLTHKDESFSFGFTPTIPPEFRGVPLL